MKGHILILSANILFGISMPVFEYLLEADVPPEAVTVMRAIFACMIFWLIYSVYPVTQSKKRKDIENLFFANS